jgi:hypothetical protein
MSASRSMVPPIPRIPSRLIPVLDRLLEPVRTTRSRRHTPDELLAMLRGLEWAAAAFGSDSPIVSRLAVILALEAARAEVL